MVDHTDTGVGQAGLSACATTNWAHIGTALTAAPGSQRIRAVALHVRAHAHAEGLGLGPLLAQGDAAEQQGQGPLPGLPSGADATGTLSHERRPQRRGRGPWGRG